MKNIIVNKDKGYIELKPKEGYLITTYKEGDDIKTYYSTNEVCAPMTTDTSIYHSVTLEQDAMYKKEKDTSEKEKSSKSSK